MPQFYDTFISYGRADSKDFATKLYHHLQAQGYEVWFDQNDIPLGVDYQQEIDEGLERSHNFIFVMSPHSVNSEYCGLEVKRAVARNKRIIPLLHVDELQRETWQGRNPQGTDADWANYQAEKRHFGDVRNPRMHPVIGKLNWIYGRENQDDLEAAFQGLVSIIERHKDYVQHHTELLIQALHWEAQQRRSQFLLVGKEREQAEAWLEQRFADEQLPCLPTELHGEFITESIKNSNNMMTQVFLAYAQEDRVTMEKIRRSLWLEGITVWTNTTDIQTGEAFKEAIDRGIEQADNVVYLLSPHSITSAYCQQELDYAIALQKRVIPILVAPTSLEQQPPELREVQYIDLTDNEREEDYLLDESQLLRILRTDENYYQTHKILLAKAFKWDRQHRNPSILLRGYNLQQTETWLKTAKTRSLHALTQLQAEFIEESLRQPPADSLDVFVSYSRSDSDFARKLNDNLQIYGKLTWFDQESIATSSANFQQEIYHGIGVSDNFLFILSPQSVNSPYCADEVEYAARLNKRFITVLYQPVDPAALHPELAKVQWLDFSQKDQEFWDSFNQLVRVLETDREYVRSHTKWSQRAIEWEEKNRSQDLLLRGSEFAIANNWLQEAHSENKTPVPTPLQELFLKESDTAITAGIRREKRQKVILRSLLGVTLLAITAIWSTAWAVKNQREATADKIDALAATSLIELDSQREFDALLSGLEAASTFEDSLFKRFLASKKSRISDETLQEAIKNTLQQALYTVTEKNRLESEGHVNAIAFSPDGQKIATVDSKSVKLWSSDGKFIKHLNIEKSSEEWTSIGFSKDGKTLVTFNSNYNNAESLQPIQIWNLLDYTHRNITDKNQKGFSSVVFSPEQTMIAGFNKDGVQLFTMDGTPIQFLEGVNYGSFSPDDQIFVGYKDDGTQLFNIDERDIQFLEGVESVYFGSDSQTLAGFEKESNKISLWDRDGSQIAAFKVEEDFVLRGLSNDGNTIAVSDEKTFKLYRRDGSLILVKEDQKIALPETHSLSGINFNPKNNIMAIHYSPKSSFENAIVQLWSTDGELIQTIKAKQSWFGNTFFSPDGQFFVTVEQDQSIQIWDMEGRLTKTIMTQHDDSITDVQYSPDGKTLVTASYDGLIKLWTPQNDLSRIIETRRYQVIFGEDKKTFITVQKNGSVQRRSLDMKNQGITLLEQSEGHLNVALSKDSKTIVITANDVEWQGQESKWYGPVQIWKDGQKNPVTLIEKVNLSKDKIDYVTAKMSPDGQRIITIISRKNTSDFVQLWNQDGTLLKTLFEPIQLSEKDYENNARVVEWNANSQSIITAISSTNTDGPIQLWDRDGKPIKTLIEAVNIPDQEKRRYAIIQPSIEGEAFITFLQSSDFYGPVQLWGGDGKPIKTLMDKVVVSPDEKSPEMSVEFNKSGQIFLTTTKQPNKNGNTDILIQLWRSNGEEIDTLIEEKNVSRDKEIAAYFSEDGKNIIMLNQEKEIKIWSIDDNYLQLIQKIEYPFNIDFINPILSPDRRLLVIPDSRRSIIIWDVESNSLLEKISHRGDTDAIFSDDSKVLATFSWDKTIKLWDREKKTVRTLKGDQSVVDLRFSKNTTMIASKGDRDQLILYQLNGLSEWDELLKRSCSQVFDYLINNTETKYLEAKKICQKHN